MYCRVFKDGEDFGGYGVTGGDGGIIRGEGAKVTSYWLVHTAAGGVSV